VAAATGERHLRLTSAELVAVKQARAYISAEKSLAEFVRQAWRILEPGEPYLHNWTTESICAHLEAVTRGEITRLIINIPPGCMKSTIVSVCWPVWEWLQIPAARYLTGSHKQKLATRDARRSRQLIESDWFKLWWGDRFSFTSDQNEKTRYELSTTGSRITFSSSSGEMGERGSRLLFDDPNDAKKAMSSEADRDAVNDTYSQVLYGRVNKGGAIVIIQQRCHEQDLTGFVLPTDKWVHLVFPMEFEPKRRCKTVLGIQDPRKKPGELLWPSLHPKGRVKAMKAQLREYGTAGQFQQLPAPRSGGIVDISKFGTYVGQPNPREFVEIIQAWDTAQKDNQVTNDPWACGTWGLHENGKIYLLHVYREWLRYPKGRAMAVALHDTWKPHIILVEDKSSGSDLIEDLKGLGLPVRGIPVSIGLTARMDAEAQAIDSGLVYLPAEAPWKADYLYELSLFDNGAHDDQVSMTIIALAHFRKRGRGIGGVRVVRG
jgi:predicted phage terminase large subunit-like protein